MRGRLDITILGSGTSTGVPVIGCDCAVCRSGLAQNQRTRCSALLSWRGRQILIDTATDLRQQALREGLGRVDAVLYTHTHADHLHGIDDLRTFNPSDGSAIPIYGNAATLAAIGRNFHYIFADNPAAGYRPRLERRLIEGEFDLFGLPVEPISLLHGCDETLGFRIGPFAYLTDVSAIPPASEARLQGLELLVLDGLRFTTHATHFNVAQAIAVAARLRVPRTLLTHLSHEIDHLRHGAQLPPGVEFAYDGQRLSLELDSTDVGKP